MRSLVLLREDEEGAVLDHNAVDLGVVDSLVYQFELGDVVLVAFAVDGTGGVDEDAHGGRGVLVVVFGTGIGCFLQGVQGRGLFEQHGVRLLLNIAGRSYKSMLIKM